MGVTEWIEKSLAVGIQLLSQCRYLVDHTTRSGNEGVVSKCRGGGWTRKGVQEADTPFCQLPVPPRHLFGISISLALWRSVLGKLTFAVSGKEERSN